MFALSEICPPEVQTCMAVISHFRSFTVPKHKATRRRGRSHCLSITRNTQLHGRLVVYIVGVFSISKPKPHARLNGGLHCLLLVPSHARIGNRGVFVFYSFGLSRMERHGRIVRINWPFGVEENALLEYLKNG